jgi:hypothetical protein
MGQLSGPVSRLAGFECPAFIVLATGLYTI